jgi:hypothetical protein
VSIEADFRKRLNAVSFYLRSLSDVEKRQQGKSGLFYRAQPALAASRAASFIMIYNCVEYGLKEALTQVKQEAAAKVVTFEELIEYWQHEIVKHRYGQKLSDGINFESFLIDVRRSMPIKPATLKDTRALPFSGNINHEKLIELARKIGDKQWKPPKASLGGSDLELVRKARNDLAHGDETFENVGSQYSIQDIAEKLNRIRLFMCSYIKMLDRYRTNARYKV